MPKYKTEVSHNLGQAEALRRLMAYTERARSFSNLNGAWNRNHLDFSVSVQGLSLSGTVQVEGERLIFEGKLPLIAMPFSGWINRILNDGLSKGHQILNEQTPAACLTSAESESKKEKVVPESSPVILFLHIPKAGGTTLADYIYNQCRAEEDCDEGLFNSGVLFLPYGFFKEDNLSVPEYAQALLRRPDLRAVIGHYWYGIHEYVERPASYITILRNPVERVISLYHYLKLEDKMSIEDFALSPPFREVDNDQTRRIAGIDPEVGKLSIADLQKAKDNLSQHFSVVGTMERFEETLVLLKRKFGWGRELISFPKNVNTAKPPVALLSPSVIENLRELNEFDYMLWQYANQLLDEAIAADGFEFHKALERYNSLRQAIKDSPAEHEKQSQTADRQMPGVVMEQPSRRE